MNIKKTLIIALIVGLLASLAPAAGANTTTKLIADPGLEKAIRKQLKKATGNLTATDLTRLTKLDATGMGVKSLRGLGGAVNLTELELYDNNVSDLMPIAGLKKLKKLYVEYNELSSICPAVGNLTALEVLDVANNGIEDVSCLNNLKNVSTLRLSDNLISEIDALVDFPAEYVELTDNMIEDISVIENWPNVTVLYLANNPLNKLSEEAVLSIRLTGAMVDLENAYDIQVYVGKSLPANRLSFRMAPFQTNGTTLVEFRTIFERLGYAIRFDSTTKTITGSKRGVQLSLRLGNKSASVNGKARTLNVAPQVFGGSTMVPLRFIAEASGLEVSWNTFTRSILISTLDEQILDTIDKNILYYNAFHTAGVMSLYSEEHPEYDRVEETLFNTYAAVGEADLELKASRESVKFISKGASQVVVEYRLTVSAKPKDDPSATPNIQSALNRTTFKKNSNGFWLIADEKQI